MITGQPIIQPTPKVELQVQEHEEEKAPFLYQQHQEEAD